MIDLHIHTKFSDGTDDVDMIVDIVINKGITHFSITDHDNIDGVRALVSNRKLMDLLQKYGVRFFSGVEFSGLIDNDRIHLLAYNYDINNSEIHDVVEIGRKRRHDKYLLRLEALAKQKGIVFSESSLREMELLDYIGNPIMSNYLVKDGVFNNRDDAMKTIKSLDIPNYETNVDANIIIPAILHAEGICVWAHPLGGLNEPRITIAKVEEIVQKLIPLGLRGIECYYNLYNMEDIENLVKIANKYNLLISAGSDYHGKNKYAKIGEVANNCEFDAFDLANIIIELEKNG